MYGLLGIAIEVVWTAFYEKVFQRKEGWDLKGTSYVWMMPIYGTTLFFFEPVHMLLDHVELVWYYRGLVYMFGIFIVEYTMGHYLDKIDKCPWDYRNATPLHINGFIRLDYAPLWFGLGLCLEHVDDLLTEMTPQIYAIF